MPVFPKFPWLVSLSSTVELGLDIERYIEHYIEPSNRKEKKQGVSQCWHHCQEIYYKLLYSVESSGRIKGCLFCKLSHSIKSLQLTMRRFTEMLLFAVCALSSTLLVTGNPGDLVHALQPTANFSPQERDIAIRGLLVSRQGCGINYYGCEERGCCPNEWRCCRNGSCCDFNHYCVVDPNGKFGCCPNGITCHGPVHGK